MEDRQEAGAFTYVGRPAYWDEEITAEAFEAECRPVNSDYDIADVEPIEALLSQAETDR